MNEITGVVRAQLDSLLHLLEEAEATWCASTRREASAAARDHLGRARRVARARVHQAVDDERGRMERELRLAAAGIETEQRRLGRERDAELIRAGWSDLEAALDARWADGEQRRAWVGAAIGEAGSLLLGREWTVEHPPGWPEAERSAAGEDARERFGAEVTFAAADDLEAGVRILNGGTVIDASPLGLLAHREAIEAELLAEARRELDHAEGGDDD